MSSWFLIDFVSTIEIDIFISLFFETSNTENVETTEINSSFVKLLKLKLSHFFKLARSAKLLRVLRHIETIGGPIRFILEQKSTSILFKSLLIVLFCHFLSCIYISIQNENRPYYPDTPNWYNTWMDGMGYSIDDKPRYFIQVLAWYMSIQTVTTVGQGDIAATNMMELFCRMLAMFVGTYIWSFVSASIISWTVEDTISDPINKKFEALTKKIISKQNIDFDGIDRINKSLLKNNKSKLDEEYDQLKEFMTANDS